MVPPNEAQRRLYRKAIVTPRNYTLPNGNEKSKRGNSKGCDGSYSFSGHMAQRPNVSPKAGAPTAMPEFCSAARGAPRSLRRPLGFRL